MKEEIENMLPSKQEQDHCLKVSCESLQGSMEQGRIEGTFTIENERKKPIRGKVLVTDPRMKVSPAFFQDIQVTISYCFEKSPAEEEEAVSGSFMIVTNHGECEIPYVFSNPKREILSSMGEIRNMFHFTNLAKINWHEAVKLYFSTDFLKLLHNVDTSYLSLYRGLSSYEDGQVREQFMEEFLQAVNKKKPVIYEIQEEELFFTNVAEPLKEEVYIHKKGWGYVNLRVEAEGSFLTLDKEVLSSEDFMGNLHKLVIYIDPKQLHQGRNWGRLILTSPYDKISVLVQVYQNGYKRIRQAVEKRRNAKWLNSRLTKLFLSLRSKQIGQTEFKKESEELLEALLKLDDRNPLIKLYIAHLCISAENYEDAGIVLERAKKYIYEEKSPVIYAYYLYLTTLILKDEEYVREVREKIETLYFRYDHLWQIAWLRMFLSRDLISNAQKKWDFLMEVMEKGCRAPAMYMEASLLLNYQPTLLTELGNLELRVLRFLLKQKLLSEGVKGVVLYLILKEREFRKHVYELCTLLCKEEESKESLQALCSLLIKGNKIGEKYVAWYEKAILAEVKLTRLYEYYMMSLDYEKEIELPKHVLMYFSYQTEISQEYGASLYRYVYDHREQLGDLYIVYFPKIERFLLKKLYSGKIDKNLGYLYEKLLFPAMITEDNARELAKIMFFHHVPIPSSNYKELIVIHSQTEKECVYEMAKGQKDVEIYNKSYELFWVDEEGNRFVEKRENIPQPYFDIRALREEVGKWVANETGLALSFCSEHNGWQMFDWYSEPQFYFLTENEAVREEIRKEIWGQLMEFYHEQEALERLDGMLEQANPFSVMPKDRQKLVQYLAERDYYEKAYEFVKLYTPENMSPKVLVRICDYMIEENKGDEATLIWYTYTSFKKGKYNITMLRYLISKFNGTSLRMAEIFRAGSNFDIDTYDLSERLLKQILTTREKVREETDIFKNYVSGGAGTNLEAAYITYRAMNYMRDDRWMDFYFMKDIERVHKRGFALPLVVHLAYLRFFAENKEKRNEAAESLLKEYLQEAVIEKGMVLPFARSYADIKGMESLGDKTVLTYKTNPGTAVLLHYRLNRGGRMTPFQRERMEEVYFGTYTKEFVLFYGEELQYYITEIKVNQEQLTSSGSITNEDNDHTVSVSKESRFQLINEITAAEQLEDYTSLEALLEEYWIKEFIVEEVFR